MSKIDELIKRLCPDGVEWKELGDVIISLKTGLNPRKNFILNSDDSTNYYVTVRELNGKSISITDKTDRVNDEALKLINKRSNIDKDDILFSGIGTVGKTALVEEKPLNWGVKEGIYVIKPCKDKILPLYLLFLLSSNFMYYRYKNKISGSPVSGILMKDLKNLKIPIPPLEVQEEIVHILDSFTELTAELTARRKQYEYYRDKLLNFKNISED